MLHKLGLRYRGLPVSCLLILRQTSLHLCLSSYWGATLRVECGRDICISLVHRMCYRSEPFESWITQVCKALVRSTSREMWSHDMKLNKGGWFINLTHCKGEGLNEGGSVCQNNYPCTPWHYTNRRGPHPTFRQMSSTSVPYLLLWRNTRKLIGKVLFSSLYRLAISRHKIEQ